MARHLGTSDIAVPELDSAISPTVRARSCLSFCVSVLSRFRFRSPSPSCSLYYEKVQRNPKYIFDFESSSVDFFELFRNIMSIRLFIHIILNSTMLKITFQNIKAPSPSYIKSRSLLPTTIYQLFILELRMILRTVHMVMDYVCFAFLHITSCLIGTLSCAASI